MKLLVLVVLMAISSQCQGASLFGSIYTNGCQDSEWSDWSSRDSIFGCSTVSRSRHVRCVESTETTERCGPPDAQETAESINTQFLGKFAPGGIFSVASGGSPPPIDLLFIIDKSGSIGDDEFSKVIGHIKDLVDLFPVEISRDNTRVSAISYSSSDRVDLDFNFKRCLSHSKTASIDCIKHEINDIDFEGGYTYTTDALLKAKDVAFTTANGARANSKKVIFLVSDGRSNGNGALVATANALKQTGVEIYALGVTSSIDEAELRSIVSDPIPDHLFYYDSFSAVSKGAGILRAFIRDNDEDSDGGFFGVIPDDTVLPWHSFSR